MKALEEEDNNPILRGDVDAKNLKNDTGNYLMTKVIERPGKPTASELQEQKRLKLQEQLMAIVG